MVKQKRAVLSEESWDVIGANGKRKKGIELTKTNVHMALRAFNAECDAIISSVSWARIHTAAEKIANSWNSINKKMRSI